MRSVMEKQSANDFDSYLRQQQAAALPNFFAANEFFQKAMKFTSNFFKAQIGVLHKATPQDLQIMQDYFDKAATFS